MKNIDIGCGRWKLAGAIGLDQDPTLASLYKPGEFVAANLNDPLPFASGEMDEVLASHIIEHFAEPRKIMLEVHRLLKPGGKFRCYYPVDNPLDGGEFGHKCVMGINWFEESVPDLFSFGKKNDFIEKGVRCCYIEMNKK